MIEDNRAPVPVGEPLRRALAAMARRIFWTGKRCERTPTGREVAPHLATLLDAAWEVAQRHPSELQMAIMKRTEQREETGQATDRIASGHRPR